MNETSLPENPDEPRASVEEPLIDAVFQPTADETVVDESPVVPEQNEPVEPSVAVEYPVNQDEMFGEPVPVEYDPVYGSSRLRELNLAIEVFPDAAMNYVLRGELFLEKRQVHLAEADFETAVSLASQQLETDSWGIVNQYVIDRALMGLNSIH